MLEEIQAEMSEANMVTVNFSVCRELFLGKNCYQRMDFLKAHVFLKGFVQSLQKTVLY